jgi:exosome complex exonuclease RRP6
VQIRNGRTEPFSFVLDSKPHGLVPPIHALLPVERMDTSIVGPAYYMPHQYEREIQSLEYNGWQLQSPDVPTAPAGWSDENFRFIDTADALQEFVAHLQQKIEDGDVREIAVDLEAHSVRSFQGLTCLMQISTRDVDVIIDVLKLRVESRALLGVFVDPRVVKVMHGAECDVLWLQRDLHIYIVNLFDTFQVSCEELTSCCNTRRILTASWVLLQAAKLMRYPALSLAHLLKVRCLTHKPVK